MESGVSQPGVNFDADVAIVGYGPAGQALAGLLGRAGHRVAVFERFGGIYLQPRAVHLSGDLMRLLQALGVADELAAEMLPVREYRWFGADGDPILTLESRLPGSSGWEPDYLFFQPALEQALDRAARSEPTVTVERGWVAERLVDSGDGVELTVRRVRQEVDRLIPTAETRTVHARWLVGADGANSFVREATGITRRDLGFQEQWLVVDVEPRNVDRLSSLPKACQWCDPRRPATHVQSGARRHRWEFMLLPGETASDFADPQRVWALLAPWCKPEDASIGRSTVYEFHSMLANRMRQRRVLLVGDAAHLTPPFLGQGLCAGLRDDANVAWKLDLVLRGLAAEDLLDTIDPERQRQNETTIRAAMALGRLLCQLDPAAAAERDAAMRQADRPPPIDLPALSGGVVHGGTSGAPDPLAGTLGVQGLVTVDGCRDRFDDAVGRGFTLIATSGDPTEALDDGARGVLDALEVTVATLDPAAPNGVRDDDGRLRAWLESHGVYAVLVRPDFYVFGSVALPAELPALFNDLQSHLGAPTPATTPDLRATFMPTSVIHPRFHHVNLKTTHLQEMIDWYSTLVGAEVIYQYDMGAWLSNDQANHRIALLAFPGFHDDPDKETRTGLHHSAFEYDNFDDLNASYLRLRDEGITPDICLDHGMTLSYYYKDPDGNRVEMQCDVFGDWAKSREWMHTSPDFHANPIGAFVDPEKVADAAQAGEAFAEIHRRAWAGELAPAVPPVRTPQATR